jgi:hypothetical protein
VDEVIRMIFFRHISDLHYHCIGSNKESDAFIGRIAAVSALHEYLLITGDVTDDGVVEQYQHAVRSLSRIVSKKFICPGNHDYGLFGNLYDDDCAKYFDDDFLPSTGWRNKGFYDKMPVVDELIDGGGTRLLLVGLNTNLETGGISDFARGGIGDSQLDALDLILGNAKYASWHKMVYMHHRPEKCSWFLELIDAEKLLSVLGDRVDILAYGHTGGDMKKPETPVIPMGNPVDGTLRQKIEPRPSGVKYMLEANTSVESQGFYEIIFDGTDLEVRVVLF